MKRSVTLLEVTMEEKWLDVVGFEDYFKVSNLGRVFSKRTNKVLKQGLSKTGYLVISTKIGGRCGKYYCLKVHRLVADTFLKNTYNKPFVNHIDGNKLNNNVDNLEWCTAKENVQHAIETGLYDVEKRKIKGELKTLSNFNAEHLMFIKSNYKPKDRHFGARSLGRMFNVSHNTIIKTFQILTRQDVAQR